MAKIDGITINLEQQKSPTKGPADMHEPCSKRFKSSTQTNVCIFCGAERTSVTCKTVHTLYRICEKLIAQKLKCSYVV